MDLHVDPAVPPVRMVYAAAHLVANPRYTDDGSGPVTPEAVDWERTLAYREHLWSWGLGVGEAMDTAQRDQGIGWPVASMLLDQTLARARQAPGRRVIGGAGADLVADPDTCSLREVVDSYLSQAHFIHERGGQVILFPTAILPARFPEPAHYRYVIDHVVAEAEGPLYLHWLGQQFDYRMAGYWGYSDVYQAAEEVVLPLLAEHADTLLGLKLSVLDPQFEHWLRVRIEPYGQVVLTGDDFNFAELIKGSEGHFSHGLLGIMDAIAPVAAKALEYLARGDTARYDQLMGPATALSRHLFEAPTPYYKVGLVFLAYLTGHQDHFHLVGGMERERSVRHLVELFKLADQAGLFTDTLEAYSRLCPLLRGDGFRV